MGESKRRKLLDPNYGKPKTDFWESIFSDPILMQVAYIYSRCDLDFRKVAQIPEGEMVARSGWALQIKTQTLDEYSFLCQEFAKLCDFIDLVEDRQKPDFLVVDNQKSTESFFIVRKGRKTYHSTEREEISIS